MNRGTCTTDCIDCDLSKIRAAIEALDAKNIGVDRYQVPWGPFMKVSCDILPEEESDHGMVLQEVPFSELGMVIGEHEIVGPFSGLIRNFLAVAKPGRKIMARDLPGHIRFPIFTAATVLKGPEKVKKEIVIPFFGFSVRISVRRANVQNQAIAVNASELTTQEFLR